jgi:hypothetical protein
MIVRLSSAALVTVVLTIGIVPPAQAKAPGRATITGPGVTEPIRVNWQSRPGMDGLLNATGVLGQLPGSDRPLRRVPAPATVGPAYVVTYSFGYTINGRPVEPIRQHLHLTSSAGPVVHTLPRTGVRGTWTKPGADLSVLLRRYGVPVRAAATVPVRTAATAPVQAAVQQQRRSFVVPAALLAAAAVVLMAWRVRRSKNG